MTLSLAIAVGQSAISPCVNRLTWNTYASIFC